MAQSRGFSLVDDLPQPEPQSETPESARPRKQPLIDSASIEMLRMSLAALSQRASIALAHLLATVFILLTVASVFVLWYLTPDPTQTQIVSLTIYAAFIVVINYLNMRRGK